MPRSAAQGEPNTAGPAPVPRTNVLGVGISAIDPDAALQHIDDWIKRRDPHYVCVTGVHGVMESRKDPELRRIHNASGLTVPDGMPMVWLSHTAGHHHVRRVYGPDLMLATCALAAREGYRLFFYGGAPGVAEQLAETLQGRFAGLCVVGTYAPPYRALTTAEEAALAALLARAEPDVIWVGLSTPKQERWMASHSGRVSGVVMIGVGAAFDFHTGRIRQAPRWMQRRGLEWLFRLWQEPRRLWRRYFLGNSLFLMHILLQRARLRSYPLHTAGE